MATTTPRALKPGADVRLREIHESYVTALADLDKAGDPEDEAYYAGLIDAYYNVLVTLGAIDPEPESKPCPMTYAHEAHTYTVNMGEPFACPGKKERS